MALKLKQETLVLSCMVLLDFLVNKIIHSRLFRRSKMGFSKRDIVLLVTALDHYMWYHLTSKEEKEECVRLNRILKKLYKQVASK